VVSQKFGNAYGFFFPVDVSEDDEFFISSSARPFDYLGVSAGGDHTDAGGSEFFPGRDLVSQDDAEPDASASDSDPEMVTASEHSVQQKGSGEDSSSDAYRSLASTDSVDGLDGADATDGDSPPPASPAMASPATANSPPSPSSPACALGELRHTRDRLKLDFLLEAPPKALPKVGLKKRSSVEQVKGEASLLDGDDVEDIDDSGIDSGIDPPRTRRTFHSRPEPAPALELAN